MNDHSRRDLFRFTAAAIAATPLATMRASAADLKFFTPDEFKLADELSEMIIPSDEHSPGARAAGVMPYIDRRIAEALPDDSRTRWRDGLKLIDAYSVKVNGATFLETTGAQRVALLTELVKNEFAPKTPEEEFFRYVKTETASVYYSSKIGIHQEIEYKGNVMLDEFVGYDAGLVQIGKKA
jgi:hypothetical protein